jgi:2,3-bisphosphoglycerate-independent phosphoglycerate mutase
VKYCIIIPDGGADLPIESLGGPDEAGRTPREAARLPNLARVAAMGRVGCAVTTPPGFEAGSDVCSMALLGYDPARYHTGRAPLEAAAIGIDPGLSDWIFRLNLVTTGDGAGRFPGDKMLDHSAGAITDGEARQLVADLVSHWKKTVRPPRASRSRPASAIATFWSIRPGRTIARCGPRPRTPCRASPGASICPRGPAQSVCGR